MTTGSEYFCGLKLRPICMVIGYLHLISSVADIACHFLTVAIVTNGFQCDVNADTLRAVTNVPYLEPILLVLNLGTHGFYPFPRIIRNQYNSFLEYMTIAAVPKCYPGMLHVYLIDVLNLFINLIWLKIVIAYVSALHKRQPEPMGMFFSLSIVKLVMQIMYLGYQPHFLTVVDFEVYWFLKILDIVIAIFLLMIVRKYAKFLKCEIFENKIEKPPSYIECLISTLEPIRRPDEQNCEKNDPTLKVEDEKPSGKDVKCNLDNPI